MKRTPPWVFVAAVGVQLAALGACVWVMDRTRRDDQRAIEHPKAEPLPRSRSAENDAASPELAARLAELELLQAELARRQADFISPTPTPTPAPQPVIDAIHPPPPPAPPLSTAPDAHPALVLDPAPEEQPPVILSPSSVILSPSKDDPTVMIGAPPEAAAPSMGPMFGPPPTPAVDPWVAEVPEPPSEPAPMPPPPDEAAAEIASAFITERTDAATQIVRGRIAERVVVFGFYGDGSIRYVDIDGGRYEGRAESARARMRELGGTRAFTVQIGVGVGGALQAHFTGGAHDTATIALEPLVGGSVS